MEGFQFIDIIILAMVAGFIVLRLRSVLGRRTGHDPNENRDSAPDSLTPDAFGRKDRGSDNVVSLPGVRRPRDATDIEPAYQNDIGHRLSPPQVGNSVRPKRAP